MSATKQKRKKSQSAAFYHEYAQEAAPLLASRSAGAAALNAPPSPTSDAGGDESAPIRGGRTSSLSTWRVHNCGIVMVNLSLFVLGCAGAGYLIFYLQFFRTLWNPMFASGLSLAAVLLLFSGVGVFLVGFHRKSPVRLLVALATLLLVGIAATEVLFFFAWSDLRNTTNRDSLSGSSLASSWAASVNVGGAQESDVCAVQRMLQCSGWRAGCWTYSGTVLGSSASDNVQRQSKLNELSLHLLSRTPSDLVSQLIGDDPNITQYGNCPVCFGDTVYSSVNRTCGDAIFAELNSVVWIVLSCGVALFLVACLVVRWVALSRKEEANEHVSVQLLAAQRYL